MEKKEPVKISEEELWGAFNWKQKLRYFQYVASFSHSYPKFLTIRCCYNTILHWCMWHISLAYFSLLIYIFFDIMARLFIDTIFFVLFFKKKNERILQEQVTKIFKINKRSLSLLQVFFDVLVVVFLYQFSMFQYHFLYENCNINKQKMKIIEPLCIIYST